MTDDATPTPRSSGVPSPPDATAAAIAAGEEIRAARPDTSAILDAIASLRTEVHQTRIETNARLQSVEQGLAAVVAKTDTNTRHIGEQADALTRVASAAAKAADLALDAKTQATRTPDEVTKLVESAMRIHTSSVSATLDAAVQRSMAPMLAEVDTLKGTTSLQNEAIGAIVNELGLEHRVQLGRSVPPGEKAPPQRPLARIESRTNRSTLVQIGVAVALIIRELWTLFHH